MTRRHSTAVGYEFDAFLFALIGEDSGGLPLSVASMLGRSNFDPWHEAARLAALPEETAVRDLTALIGALPHRQLSPPDTLALARRVIALLPRAPKGGVKIESPPRIS